MKHIYPRIFVSLKAIRQISISILLLLILPGSILAQSYSGVLKYGTSTINYQVKLVENGKQTKAFFSSIEMNAFEIPCQGTRLTKDALQFSVISDYYTYAYQLDLKKKGFQGNLKIYSNESEELLNTIKTNLILDEIAEDDAIVKEDYTFISNDLKLSGTLWKPKTPNGKGLLFVTSSQGNDRSATNAEANYLAGLGYSVFHYDKRGTGKSEGNWQSATIEELCSDDINAAKFFSETTGTPLSKTGVKGSSQGGIKVPYILTRLPELGFGISVSCPSGTLLESDLNRWQLENQENIGKENIGQAVIVQESAYDFLAGNISYESLEKIKSKYAQQDWMQYVWIPEREVQIDKKLNFSGLPYFKELTQPVLVIQGLSDKVIPISSFKIIKEAIGVSKAPYFDVITLKNTSHSMTYSNVEYPYFELLTPEYISSMTEWLSKFN